MTVNINLMVGKYMASPKIGVPIWILSTSLIIYLTLAEIVVLNRSAGVVPNVTFSRHYPACGSPPRLVYAPLNAPQQGAFRRASERYLVRGESNA
jgi:hypothetical protein